MPASPLRRLITVWHERYRSCAYSFCQTDAGSVGHTAKEAGNPGEVEPGNASAIGAALVRAPSADSVAAPTLLARHARQPGVAYPQGEALQGDDEEVEVVCRRTGGISPTWPRTRTRRPADSRNEPARESV